MAGWSSAGGLLRAAGWAAAASSSSSSSFSSSFSSPHIAAAAPPLGLWASAAQSQQHETASQPRQHRKKNVKQQQQQQQQRQQQQPSARKQSGRKQRARAARVGGERGSFSAEGGTFARGSGAGGVATSTSTGKGWRRKYAMRGNTNTATTTSTTTTTTTTTTTGSLNSASLGSGSSLGSKPVFGEKQQQQQGRGWHHAKEMSRMKVEAVKESLSRPCELFPKHWCALAVVAAEHGDLALCKEVVRVASISGFRFDVRTYTRMVHGAARRKRWVMAGALLELMRQAGSPANEVTYTALLSEMARAGQFDLVDEVIRTESIVMSVDIYNALISGCSKGGHTTQAFSFFDEMVTDAAQPTVMTFSSLLTCSGRSKAGIERAEGVFETMKQMGVEPDIWCLNAYMGLLVASARPWEAMSLYESMSERGVVPDIVSLNTAVAALEKLDQSEKALELLRDAENACQGEDICGPIPNRITYNSVISCVGKAGLWQEALCLLEEMLEKGRNDKAVAPCPVTYNSVMSACARGGHPEISLNLFREMPEMGMERDVYSYGAALHACLAAGDWEQALSLLDQMKREGIKGSSVVYGTAVNACLDAGELQHAAEITQRATSEGECFTGPTMTRLLEALAEADRHQLVTQIVDQVLRSHHVKRSSKGSVLVSALAACSAGKPQPEYSIVLLHHLRPNRRLLAKGFVLAIKACRCAGDADATHRALLLLDSHDISRQEEPDLEAAVESVAHLTELRQLI